ncbi:MAG TPA: glycosyltransferase [Terriglobales bacterium]|nr:glycosyltransferase [Terriglobales bacterium]
MIRYVIITPARDEEQHIEGTVRSVVEQTLRPTKWIIVDDGSSDRTGEIIDQYAVQFPFIRAIHRRNRGSRKAGSGVMEAFYDGYNALQDQDWDFLIKLDGDLSFSPDYFQKCFEHFSQNPRVGIGGGEIYHEFGGQLKLEASPKFHVRGATKIYRRECWDAIGGLLKVPGWDTIDEVKANMLGWNTSSFPELRLVHHRLTGAADGLLRDRIKYGTVCFTCGYHPLFVLARCLYRIARKPYIIGSVGMLFGFLKGYFTNMPRLADERLVRYVRAQQLRRLCGLKTVWR